MQRQGSDKNCPAPRIVPGRANQLAAGQSATGAGDGFRLATASLGERQTLPAVLYRHSDWSENEDTSQAPPYPFGGFIMAWIHSVFSFDNRASTHWNDGRPGD